MPNTVAVVLFPDLIFYDVEFNIGGKSSVCDVIYDNPDFLEAVCSELELEKENVKIIASDRFSDKSFFALVYTGAPPPKIEISGPIKGLRRESAVKRRGTLASLANETYMKLSLDTLIFIVPILQSIISEECSGKQASLDKFKSLVSEFDRKANEFRDSQEYQWLSKTRERGISLLEESEAKAFDEAANEVLDLFKQICDVFFQCRDAAIQERPSPRRSYVPNKSDEESKALRAEVEKLRSEIAEKDQEISELRLTQKKYTEILERVRVLEKQNMELESSCRDLESKKQETVDKWRAEIEKNANLSSYASSLRDTITSQKDLLTESKKRNEELQRAIEDFKERLASLKGASA